MSPVVPHLANECLERFDFKGNLNWPEIDKKYLINEKNLVVIQVNGKKRNTVSFEQNLDEKELIDLIKNKGLISKYLDNGELTKTIYIKNKLINFIIR